MNNNWAVAVGIALAPFAVRVASAQGLSWRLAGEHRVNICQMAFDLARNRFITVSEPNSTESALLTAEWNGSTWQTRTTATAPPPRTGFGLTYDIVRSRIVMFGGRPPYGPGPLATMNDLWVYDGVDWVDVSPSVRPPARHSPAIAYDLGRNEVVIAGGLTQSEVPQTDTWAWDGASWRQVPSPLPPFQTAAMALFWPSLHLVLLGNTSATASETWEYDGIAWSRRLVPSPVAANYRMTSDLGLGRIAMLAAQSAMLWEWDGATWTTSQAALDGRRDCGFAN